MDKINEKIRINNTYIGFEQGPIRPPSEAYSLLIRVTRNCPWNRCTFCPIYKKSKFSIRPVDHVLKDIDIINKHIKTLKEVKENSGSLYDSDIHDILKKIDSSEINAFNTAYNWFYNGMESVFLQDSNSLIIKPNDLIRILNHIKLCFPWIKRITSYARSSTIIRISDDDLLAIGNAGLNRIHIGLESGSDEVLKMVKKGATKEIHIRAGIKVKKAGIELSEYIMPGLGGVKLSKIHALESADAINKIDPEFIRLRPLAIPPFIPLYKYYTSGDFKKCTDQQVVKEIKIFIENLEGITSILKSDHILNLFANLNGKLPEDKNKMLKILNDFLKMKPKQKRIYQLGRRLGIFSQISDMKNLYLLDRVEKYYHQMGITRNNIDSITDELMKRYI